MPALLGSVLTTRRFPPLPGGENNDMVGVVLGFSLLLVLVLDRPFAGDLCVPPTPFKQSALARFW